MSELFEIKENIKQLRMVETVNSENTGDMFPIIENVKSMLLAKYSEYIKNLWYLDITDEANQVFFLCERNNNLALMEDDLAGKVCADIDMTVGYDNADACGAVVYDYEENFLEKADSLFINFREVLEHGAIFRVI